MERIEKLEAEFQKLLAKGFLSPHLAFTKAGIALGAGCLIAPLRSSASGKQTHDFSGKDRILVLLSAAFGRSIGPAILGKLQHASEIFAGGDPCLASIYLTQLPLSRLDQEHMAWSLFLADRLIEAGYAPQDLAKALGFELPEGLRKFDSDQPRDDHGRWTSGGGSGAAGGDGSAAPVVEGRSVSSRKPGQTANIVASNEKDKEYEQERRQGTESPKDDIEHGRPVPLPTELMPGGRTEGGLPLKVPRTGADTGSKGPKPSDFVGQDFGKLGVGVEKPELKIEGFTGHANDRMSEYGQTSVDIQKTVSNPLIVLQQSDGRFYYLSDDGAVVLDQQGKVVTGYPASKFDDTVKAILNHIHHGGGR